MEGLAAAVGSALAATKTSQRELAGETGISQSTLSRILSGDRTPKMTEVILIADALGCTIAQLTGSAVKDRVLCAARSENGSNMEAMKQRLLHFMELDEYLDDYAIPTA